MIEYFPRSGEFYVKKRLFCDGLYLLGLKRALIDGKEKIKFNEQYDITVTLDEGQIYRGDMDGGEYYPALAAVINLQNINTSLFDYSLSIMKYHSMFAANKNCSKIQVVKGMNDYQKNNFILERDTSSFFSFRRYYLNNFEGMPIDNNIYQCVREQAAKDYQLLKQYQMTLTKKI